LNEQFNPKDCFRPKAWKAILQKIAKRKLDFFRVSPDSRCVSGRACKSTRPQEYMRANRHRAKMFGALLLHQIHFDALQKKATESPYIFG
jgi:hypothetical protein